MPKAQFITTVTERANFRDCRRRWYYETFNRLVPHDAVQWNLMFGTAMHTALEAYYMNQRDLQAATGAFGSDWHRLDLELQHTFGQLYVMGIEEEWWSYKMLGNEMLVNYDKFDRTHPFFDEVLHVNIEERSYIPILGPTRRILPGHPLLSGRIDLVGTRRDGIWIMDHKTAAQRPSYRALDVDDQLTGYSYIYWRLFGEVPRGAVYNVLIKRVPEPPKELKDGSLSKDKSQNTSYQLYVQALKERGIKDVTPYQDILDALQARGYRDYFDRDSGITRTLAELQSFEQRLYQEYRDMQDALRTPARLYPNPGQRTCPTCSVFPICQTVEEQGDVDWVIDYRYRVGPERY